MAGFFDGMGTGRGSSGSAVDFARNGATNPGAVPATGFYDRLFGHKRSPGAGPHIPLIDAGSPASTPAIGPPSISSGNGLIKRILASVKSPPAYNTDGQPLVPGTEQTVPQFMQKIGGGVQTLMHTMMSAAAPPAAAGSLPQGPAPMQPPMRPGPALPPGAPGMGPRPPMGPPPPLPRNLPPGGAMPGFFRGGRYMRGGYPEHLMMGLPMRHAHGGDAFVPDRGTGDGRSDNVDARLSPGEYIMDGETVALLGNGNNNAGARKLDQMRHNLRKQKGKALAKGKFSPNAKDPEDYIK